MPTKSQLAKASAKLQRSHNIEPQRLELTVGETHKFVCIVQSDPAGPARQLDMTRELLPVCIAAMVPLLQRVHLVMSETFVHSHLLRWTKATFRKALDGLNLFCPRRRHGGTGLLLNRGGPGAGAAAANPEYDSRTLDIWRHVVFGAVNKYNPKLDFWLTSQIVDYGGGRTICIQVEDCSADFTARLLRDARTLASANLAVGAQAAIDRMQATMDLHAVNMFWIVCTTTAGYNAFRETFRGFRHEDSVYKTAVRGPFGTIMPVPMDAAAVMQKDAETRAKFRINLETAIEGLVAPAAGVYPNPTKMLTLILMLQFVEGRLNIDLRDVNCRVNAPLKAVAYCDGWPCGNVDMCDTSWWIVDYRRMIWKDGISHLIFGALWSVAGEKLLFRLFERGCTMIDGGEWTRLEFPFAALTNGEWADTWLEIKIGCPEIFLAGDNKLLCMAAGTVGGSGHCRGHWAFPWPVRLFSNMQLLKLATYFDKMKLWVRSLVFTADALCDMLDNKHSFLPRERLVQLLEANGQAKGGARVAQNKRLATPGFSQWNDILTLLAGTNAWEGGLLNDRARIVMNNSISYCRKHLGSTHFVLGSANAVVEIMEVVADIGASEESEEGDEPTITAQTMSDLLALLKLDARVSPYPLLDRCPDLERSLTASDFVTAMRELREKSGASLKQKSSSFADFHATKYRNKMMLLHGLLSNGDVRLLTPLLALLDAALLKCISKASWLNFVYGGDLLLPFLDVERHMQHAFPIHRHLCMLIARSNQGIKMRGRPTAADMHPEGEAVFEFTEDGAEVHGPTKIYCNSGAEIAFRLGLEFVITELTSATTTINQKNLYHTSISVAVHRAAQLYAQQSTEFVGQADEGKGEGGHSAQTHVKGTLTVRGRCGPIDNVAIRKCYRVAMAYWFKRFARRVHGFPALGAEIPEIRHGGRETRNKNGGMWGGKICKCVFCFPSSPHASEHAKCCSTDQFVNLDGDVFGGAITVSDQARFSDVRLGHNFSEQERMQEQLAEIRLTDSRAPTVLNAIPSTDSASHDGELVVPENGDERWIICFLLRLKSGPR
eukprot:COSAG01_NODE_6453_length_3659_cov_33.578371_1_plen_1059_part_00